MLPISVIIGPYNYWRHFNFIMLAHFQCYIVDNRDKQMCNSLCLNFFTYLPESQIYKKNYIYSNKFFHNFHLSESNFTCPGLRASGLARRLCNA